MTIPTWLPIVISSVGVMISLSAFTWQIQRARFNQSIDLLFRLESDFFGASKKAQRVKAAHDLLAGKVLEAEPILDFFETMALLLRRGALDEEMVEHTFFYWIDRYYEASKDYIAKRRATDPRVWRDLGTLVSQLRALQAKVTPNYNPPTTEQVSAFLAEELTEAA